MRNFFFIIFLSLFGFQAFAADLTSDQLKFRSSLEQFLKEEGYVPYIDNSDNSLCFKKEGHLFYITVGENGPFYVQFNKAGFDSSDLEEGALILAVSDVTKETKCVKASKNTSTISFAIEMFCDSPEDFKYVFFRSMSALDFGYKKFDEAYEKYKGGSASVSSGGGSSSYVTIRDLFPVNDITVGKTTYNDLASRGVQISDRSSGTGYNCWVNDIMIIDNDGDKVFEEMLWDSSDPLPTAWTNKYGIRMDLSYNQWMSKLKAMGFNVVVRNSPKTVEFSGRKTLEACLVATSPDQKLELQLDFEFGNSNNEGYSVDSPKTLGWLFVTAK